MDYQTILQEIFEEVQPLFGQGQVATYIPALAKVPTSKLGIAVTTVAGDTYHVGDAHEPFSIQSISKLFTVTFAIQTLGDDLWQRVGREPSGTPFNSLVQLEYEQGIPRNPFINAGAHILADIVLSQWGDGKRKILEYVRALSDNAGIAYDLEVAESERMTGHRNRALANFLKSYDRLDNEVTAVLDVYFHQCALAMSCVDLSHAFLYLANNGVSPITQERLLTYSQTKRLNALMLTCGLYDAAGDFAYRVGLPGKSGVGGGIVAIIPRTLCICVWSPELNNAGNSLIGTQVLELFTTKTGISVF